MIFFFKWWFHNFPMIFGRKLTSLPFYACLFASVIVCKAVIQRDMTVNLQSQEDNISILCDSMIFSFSIKGNIINALWSEPQKLRYENNDKATIVNTTINKKMNKKFLLILPSPNRVLTIWTKIHLNQRAESYKYGIIFDLSLWFCSRINIFD